MNTKEKIEEILLTDYQYVDCYTVQKLLDLFAVMQRSEQLVCDKCKYGLSKSKSFEKGTCVHCRDKIEQTNCA